MNKHIIVHLSCCVSFLSVLPVHYQLLIGYLYCCHCKKWVGATKLILSPKLGITKATITEVTYLPDPEECGQGPVTLLGSSIVEANMKDLVIKEELLNYYYSLYLPQVVGECHYMQIHFYPHMMNHTATLSFILQHSHNSKPTHIRPYSLHL